MKIFSGTSGKHLAKEIADQVGGELSSLELHVFPDGEKRVRVGVPVVGEEVVLVQSTGIPTDENYMELFLEIEALKRSGAEFVTTVVPYMGYSRQDHVFLEGEGVSLSAIIKILEALGMTKMVTMDLHSIKTPELFNVEIKHLSAIPLFAAAIRKEGIENIAIVTPDLGGIRRVEGLSQALGRENIVKITKDRDLHTGEIGNSNIEGEVEGKTAIMVDDIISTGNTLAKAAETLKDSGAEKVYAYVTHAVFAQGAKEILESSEIEKVIVTDTIEIAEKDRFDRLQVLPVGKAFAEAIM
jgi:ribose-phosphate pyrophosphokinase